MLLKTHVLWLLAAMFILACATGCEAQVVPPTPTSRPSTPQEPTETPWPTLTPLPDSWVTYTSSDLHVTFRYPDTWKAESATRYSGSDGFWQLMTVPHTISQFDSLGAVCALEANRNKPVAYGAYPVIEDWWNGDGPWSGCLVSPSAGLPAGGRAQTTLFIRYPQRLKPDTLLVLRTDPQHAAGILSTLHLTDAGGTPTPSSGTYDAPVCHTPPPAPRAVAPGAVPADLTLQTYSIAKAGCDPYNQFDGFRTAVPAEALAALRRWQTGSSSQRLAEANATLASFGYHLDAHGSPSPDYDVIHGATRVVTDATQFGLLSANQAGDDFALVLHDWDRPERETILVRRGSVDTFDWTEAYTRPFNFVYLGNDLLSLSYDAVHTPPDHRATQLNVLRNGQVIYTLSIPHWDPGGGPVKGLTVWAPHWVLEVDGVVVIDGQILNDVLGYDEIFEWHLINGKPFYFFRQGKTVGLSYDGQTLPWRYDDVIHGFLCCDPAVYNVQSSEFGVWFYARVNDVWSYVGLTP